MCRSICISFVLVVIAATAHAQLDVRMENYLLRSALSDQAELGSGPTEHLKPYLRREPSANTLNLTTFNARFLGLEPYQVGHTTLAMEGAATAATLGLFAGAVGTTLGAFDEKTAWYVTGAMAAIGAIMGTVKANEPSNRLRWRWETGVDDHWGTQDGPRDLERK